MTALTTAIKVLLVEDNETLRDELVGYLCHEGFAALGLGDGLELNEQLKREQPDVLMLDLNLQFEDGISIARRIRVSFPDVRIVMLTGRGRGADRTEGYEAGADVYLTKPTRPAEISAVIRNLHRRARSDVGDDLRWSLDSANFMLRSSRGGAIRLTVGEVTLLYALAVAGRHVDHPELMALFHQGDSDERAGKNRLMVLISRLRLKLRAEASCELDIRVLRGRGYQLTFPLACQGPGPVQLIQSSNPLDD